MKKMLLKLAVLMGSVSSSVWAVPTDYLVLRWTEQQGLVSDFHQVVMDAVGAAIRAVSEDSYDEARLVMDMKKEITRITNSAATHEAQRLVANEPHRIEAYTIEMDIAEKLQRIFYFARRMARTIQHD